MGFRLPFLDHANGGRVPARTDRPTNTEATVPVEETLVPIDAEALARAEQRISDLDRKLDSILCSDLAGLKGFFGDDMLALAVIGSIENRVDQCREQIRPLREAAQSLPRFQQAGERGRS